MLEMGTMLVPVNPLLKSCVCVCVCGCVCVGVCVFIETQPFQGKLCCI
jgi:hypothetical protein